MRLHFPILGITLAVAIEGWPAHAQEHSRKGAIDYGAQISGTFSGGEAKRNMFIKYDNDSEWTFWLISRSCFRIDIYRLLKNVPIDTSKTNLTISGRVFFITTKGKQQLLKQFSESIHIHHFSDSLMIFKPSPLYIELSNDGSLQDRKIDGLYRDLVIEVESPINFRFAVSQPQPWGGDLVSTFRPNPPLNSDATSEGHLLRQPFLEFSSPTSVPLR